MVDGLELQKGAHRLKAPQPYEFVESALIILSFLASPHLAAGCEMQRGRLLFPRLPINSMIGMTKRVRDFFFVLAIDEYRLLKECLPRHSVGYNALDLDVPAGEGKRAFTCSENELRDIIQSVVQKFPIGKALATLIRQQWQPRSKARSKKPKKSKKR
jgi:hypothetical protein